MQEYRRLYVALTRAEEILIVTYSIVNEVVDKLLIPGDIVKC